MEEPVANDGDAVCVRCDHGPGTAGAIGCIPHDVPRERGVVSRGRDADQRATWQGPPRWVALGDAAPIDAAVDAALTALHGAPTAPASNAALQALDALVFGPIRPQLPDASQVILAPDGKLDLVPFEALVDPQGHYEVEQRLMSYVTSGRDLLRLAAPRAPRSPAVIVASPDYGPSPSPAAPGTGSAHPHYWAAFILAGDWTPLDKSVLQPRRSVP